MCRRAWIPACFARSEASSKALSWASMDGWPGMSAHAKWDQTPSTTISPSACALSAASISSGQAAADAPPREIPVSTLRWTFTVLPVRLAAAAISSTSHGAPADRSTPLATASSSGSPGGISQASTGAVIAAVAQRDGLPDRRDPQTGRPALQRGRRAGDHSVAVGVGLDRRHHLGPAGGLLEEGGIVADGGQVDPGLGRSDEAAAHASIFAAVRRCRITSGNETATSSAAIGAPSAAFRAARPCRKAAALPAS